MLNTTTGQQNSKHKKLCQSGESNPGPIALTFGAIPLDHRDNFTYQWQSRCLNVMGRNINKLSQIFGPHFFNKVVFP